MSQYRSRPVVVEAVQWFPGVACAGIREFDNGPTMGGVVGHFHDPVTGLDVIVPEGWWVVYRDGVVVDVEGPNDFPNKYEPVLLVDRVAIPGQVTTVRGVDLPRPPVDFDGNDPAHVQASRDAEAERVAALEATERAADSQADGVAGE